jgi:penicillin amidase
LTSLALVLAAAVSWIASGVPVPAARGEIAVSGLGAPVEVLFDRWGVPHVYARDAEDVWFAAGYLQARERLWQMELYRRAASGRLSELFGEVTLPADRRFAALALRSAAESEWARASPDVRTALARHAAGVNAVVKRLGRFGRPLELQLLGVTPEPWTPIDALAIGKLMAWRLAENRHGELVRGALARAVGEVEAVRLMGPLPAWAPPVFGPAESPRTLLPALPPLGVVLPTSGENATALPPGLEWLAATARPAGSNSWVVGGGRTKSGRPLLANDPHLGIEMPSIWYEMHLVAAGLEVAGATIPGEPFVIIGHNQWIAWGLTNTGADVQDFYVEEVDFASRKYLYENEWLPLRVDRAAISVRGRAKPETYEIFRTRHGPLIATEADWEDPPVFTARDPRPAVRPLALRWEALSSGETAGAFAAIDSARNWDEFLDAVRRFGAPSQNFVYADVSGNIGYAMSGALPVRAQGDGAMPVPGWTGAYEWVGRVPAARLPARLNPSSSQFVTANAEIDPSWGMMTRDWVAPFRAKRIADLLGARTGLDAAAMGRMQRDVYGEGARPLVAALERAARAPAMSAAEPQARAAIDELRRWNGQVDDRPVVSLFHAFEHALWRRTFADELDARLFQQLFEYGLDERYVGVYSILDDPESSWWDDIATVDRRETRDDIMVLAAADAVLALQMKFGDRAAWSWSRLHAASFSHALGGGGAILDWFFSRGPVPVGGDSSTIDKASIDRRRPYRVSDVASYRQIVEAGAWDRTLAVNTTGQSGHPRSAHYFDQNALWARGGYRPFAFSRAAVEQARESRLLLTPLHAGAGRLGRAEGRPLRTGTASTQLTLTPEPLEP